MNTLQDLFQQAQLAEAAYTNLAGITPSTSPSDLALILANPALDGSFSTAQATEFATHWRVISHQPDTVGGFSATLFQRVDGDTAGGFQAGQYFYAIRGTAGIPELKGSASHYFWSNHATSPAH